MLLSLLVYIEVWIFSHLITIDNKLGVNRQIHCLKPKMGVKTPVYD